MIPIAKFLFFNHIRCERASKPFRRPHFFPVPPGPWRRDERMLSDRSTGIMTIFGEIRTGKFDCSCGAFYVCVVSGSADAGGAEKNTVRGHRGLTRVRSFILDIGKPTARWRRKAMGPSWVARLPKG
jgi:hypothetical protein